MIKYWINQNIKSIENGFESYRKASFSKADVPWNEPDDFAKIEKGVFEYHYITSRTSRSSWMDEDDEEDYETMNEFNQEHRDSALAFVVSMIVPRLKKGNVRKLVKAISKNLKNTMGNYRSDYYTSYGYDKDIISIEEMMEIAQVFLKEHDIYRDKKEFTKHS